MYYWLDRAPLGRHESGAWFCRNDEYDRALGSAGGEGLRLSRRGAVGRMAFGDDRPALRADQVREAGGLAALPLVAARIGRAGQHLERHRLFFRHGSSMRQPGRDVLILIGG